MSLKNSPLPLVCSPSMPPICVVQPQTPTVCTPLPPCAVHSVPATGGITLAIVVLLLILIAAIALRSKP